MATKNIWIHRESFRKKFKYYRYWLKINDDLSYEKITIKKTFKNNNIKYNVSYFKFIKNGYTYIHQYHLSEHYEYINTRINKIIKHLNEKYDLNNKKVKLINNINDIYDE
jgi:hypothetical protein